MDSYTLKYWDEQTQDPQEFLQALRCTTEPLGGSVEYDEEGDLVDYEVAVKALEKQKKQTIEEVVKYIDENLLALVVDYNGHHLQMVEVVKKQIKEMLKK